LSKTNQFIPVRKANKVRINLDILLVQLKLKNYKLNLFSFLKVCLRIFRTKVRPFFSQGTYDKTSRVRREAGFTVTKGKVRGFRKTTAHMTVLKDFLS
jgi:hypothetical protein